MRRTGCRRRARCSSCEAKLLPSADAKDVAQLRAAVLHKAVYVHAAQPHVLPPLLQQLSVQPLLSGSQHSLQQSSARVLCHDLRTLLPPAALVALLDARAAPASAADEERLLCALGPWAAAHSLDELAALVPSLQLPVLPLPALQRHGRGLFAAALAPRAPEPTSADPAAALRRALVNACLPVLRECGAVGAALADAEEPPSHLTCPISHVLFVEPIVAADGFTYERKCIAEHFEVQRKRGNAKPKSPLTMGELPNQLLVPNQLAKSLAAAFASQCKRPRPTVSASSLVVEALSGRPLPPPAAPPAKRAARNFGAERTNEFEAFGAAIGAFHVGPFSAVSPPEAPGSPSEDAPLGGVRPRPLGQQPAPSNGSTVGCSGGGGSDLSESPPEAQAVGGASSEEV